MPEKFLGDGGKNFSGSLDPGGASYWGRSPATLRRDARVSLERFADVLWVFGPASILFSPLLYHKFCRVSIIILLLCQKIIDTKAPPCYNSIIEQTKIFKRSV